MIWAGDICAYLVGRPFGRTPFFARISPRKTWEGALAGLAGSLLAAWAFAHWFWKTADVKTVMLIAAWIAVAGQVGDLVESAIKRGANQKDSGTLLPGHGGFSTASIACCLARRRLAGLVFCISRPVPGDGI